MELLTREEAAELEQLASHDPTQALDLIRQNVAHRKDDQKLGAQYGALAIDIGSDLYNSAIVEEGIRCLEAVKQGLAPTDIRPELLYNLGNGYYALDRIARHEQDFCFDPDNTPLRQTKHYYQKALQTESSLDHSLREQLRINYGNCLAHLGRLVEAIEVYNDVLRLNPNHPMAQGNLGVELSYFAHIAQNAVFLSDALSMLKKALANDRLEEYGGPSARRSFENARQQIQSILSGRNPRAHAVITATTAQPEELQAYIDFCRHHGLFLSFCLRYQYCERYDKDNLGFSLTTDIDDDTSFILLSRVINEIKESYAFARFLLFQSRHPLIDTVAVDGLTTFVDNLDYAVYGTRVASLKLAFESGYSILDKIAHFVNRYLDLKIPPHLIGFDLDKRLWRESKDKPLRSKIRALGNFHLYALYDIAKDLDTGRDCPIEGGYLGHLRRIRNRLTHEYVIPHVEGTQWTDEPDGTACHVAYRSLLERTLALLHLVKAAIIYLIAFIDQEESKKYASDSKSLLIPVTDYDVRLFGAALE